DEDVRADHGNPLARTARAYRTRTRFGFANRPVRAAGRLGGVITVALNGAGSVEFTRNVVADLCSYEELRGDVRITLHDIDEERLTYAARAAESIVRRSGAGHTVEAHAERRAALAGADFVIN